MDPRAMTPAQLRRLYRATRTLDPARMAALQDRYDRAEAVLRAALDSGPLAFPGYRVTLAENDRPTVSLAPNCNDAAQMALWRAMQADG